MAVSRPNLWVFAGPNGSGKSTFYGSTEVVGADPFWIVNPDLLTNEIAAREELEWLVANGKALDRIMQWLEASIEMYRPVGFETVLSSDKYLPLLKRALALGFQLRLFYVALNDPQLNLERIKARVAQGGHDVAPDKVIARRERSFDMLGKVLPLASFAQVWDNSARRRV